ncbi:MAG: permease [Rhizobium sp.]|nr:permease [Rhizobium sp.]
MPTSSAHPSVASASISTAVLAMLLGMLMFSLNDAMGKWLVTTYSVGQLLFIRSFVAVIVLAPFMWKIGIRQLFFVERPVVQVVRVILATAEVFAFYLAVSYLPLADVMTYWLAAPIYIAALSPLMLGEHVGWRRWMAIGVGFLGVIIALKPSSAMFTLPALISIFGTMAFAVMLIMGRSLRKTPGPVLVFWQMAAASIAGLCTTPFMWTPPTAIDLGWMALLGVVAMLAHVLMTYSMKIAPAATVAPLQYTLLFWAVVFGWLFFGDIPSVPMMIGAALIVCSGLYIFFREHALKKHEKVLPAVPE